MKTSMSRFQIHDDLTAPEGSVPVLRGALATGGQLPNFLGVLAGSPAALRAYARFRSELRHGKLTLATLERIALAVAEYYGSEPGIEMHSRTARAAGLALDDPARLELLHPLGEKPVGELGNGLRDLGEAQRSVHQDAQDRAGPAPADQLDGLVVERTAACGARLVPISLRRVVRRSHRRPGSLRGLKRARCLT